MTITQLRYFIVAAQTENLLKAAAALYISQSTLSKNIASLEKELGEAVMGDSDYVTVEPGQRCRLLFDAGTVTNAYMRYETEGGRDAELTFTYFEKFTKGIYEVKRDDYLHGEIGKNG